LYSKVAAGAESKVARMSCATCGDVSIEFADRRLAGAMVKTAALVRGSDRTV
jgi:hypothetical protein